LANSKVPEMSVTSSMQMGCAELPILVCISQFRGCINALGASLAGEAMGIWAGDHFLVAHTVLMTEWGEIL